MEQLILVVTAMAGVAAYAINVELGKGGVLGSAIVADRRILFPPLLANWEQYGLSRRHCLLCRYGFEK